MTSRILAFAGCKQSGKTTCSNFIHGYQLRANDVVEGFEITNDGKLVVDATMVNHQGNEEKGKAFLDVTRVDPEFSQWAMYSMWPYVKNYSFAGPLKELAVGLFDLKEEQVYGTNIQKNTKTHLRWEDVPGVITCLKTSKLSAVKKLIDDGTLVYHKKGKMTGREFLQFFGSEISRRIYEEIWVSRLIKDVELEGSLLAVIDDCRYPNEAEAIQSAGGKVIKLTRSTYKDAHKSENAFNKDYQFDAVLDNKNMSIHETNVEIMKKLDEWGWLGKEVTKEEKITKEQPELVGGIHKFREDSQ